MPRRPQIASASTTLLCAALLLAATATAAPRGEPRALRSTLRARLIRALANGERAELERVAILVGEGGLLAALRGSGKDRAFALAAIAAAPAALKSWTLLPALSKLFVSTRDRSLAIAAGQAALRIAEDLRAPRLARHDETPRALLPLVRRLLKLARDGRRSVDIRVTAVMIAAQICAQLDLQAPAAVGALLVVPEPAIRRAALEVAAAHPDARALFLRLLAEDKEAGVRRAAAANLCAALPSKRTHRRRMLADPLLRKRLRRASAAKKAPPDELRDIARCLQVFAPREARRLRRALKAR